MRPKILLLDSRSHEKQPNIKLILIDETKNFDNLHRSLRCGAIDYLVRPLSKQELQHSIHRSILSLNQISLLHYSTSAITDNIAEQVNQIIEYIHLNYQEPITLDVLAAFSHMHRNYISRIFKEATGMTFTKYLTFYRIEQSKSCWLLRRIPLLLSLNKWGMMMRVITPGSSNVKPAIHRTNTAKPLPLPMLLQI